MNESVRRRHRLSNGVQSLMLVVGMATLLGTLGWIVAGGTGMLWAISGGVVLVLLSPRLSPRLLVRRYRARLLEPNEAPELFQLVRSLATGANLSKTPTIYYIPSPLVNAFAVGGRTDAVVAVTDGILRRLSSRELAGVLAHEMSHIQHNDMWVMGLADLMGRMTSIFSTLGQLLILLNLPLLLFSSYHISWLAIIALVLAPALSAVLQLALSRSREFAADLGAVRLTRDPQGLASALAKLSHYEGSWIEQILMPGRRLPEPSLLRTHPPTRERVRRLLELNRETT